MPCFGQDYIHAVLEGRTLVLRGTQRPPWPLQMPRGWLYAHVLPAAVAPLLLAANTHCPFCCCGMWADTGTPSETCSSPPVTSSHLSFGSAPPCATLRVDKLCQKPPVSLPFLFSFTGGNCPCARQRGGFSSSFPTQAACTGAGGAEIPRANEFVSNTKGPIHGKRCFLSPSAFHLPSSSFGWRRQCPHALMDKTSRQSSQC